MTKLMTILRQDSSAFRKADIIPATDLHFDDGACDGQGNRGAGALRGGHAVEAIPRAVHEHAKLVLLDTLGRDPGGFAPARGRRRARRDSPRPAGWGRRSTRRAGRATDPRTAALLNGLAGRSIELCEGHRYVSCQGAVQVLPTALASAEWLERSGRETLAALIFGYEVAARLGAGLTARPLAHQNGQAPLLGAVAAGARLRGLTGEQTSLALRIGAILVLTPGYTNAVAGATALNVAGGMSGFAGALAPELALAGVAAQPNAIEEAFGQLVGDGFRPEAVTEELGQRWEIARNYFRLRACCNPIYTALDALEDILADASTRSRPASSASTWRPTASPRTCASPTRRTTSRRSTRCRTRPPRWSCEAMRGITPSPTTVVRDPADRGLPPAGHGPRGSRAQRAGAATQAGAGDRHVDRRPPGDPAARERPRRLPGSVRGRRDPVEIPRSWRAWC